MTKQELSHEGTSVLGQRGVVKYIQQSNWGDRVGVKGALLGNSVVLVGVKSSLLGRPVVLIGVKHALFVNSVVYFWVEGEHEKRWDGRI